ncbi:MAG: hypothetical protein V7K97_07230, partial [Nostoc sp.]|uniref:hypothetical protein n=1 Tax=Nostoc sp. TaxID=1180 RepID=UPI002FF8C417
KQWRLLSITLPKMMPSVGSITVVYLPENCCNFDLVQHSSENPNYRLLSKIGKGCYMTKHFDCWISYEFSASP